MQKILIAQIMMLSVITSLFPMRRVFPPIQKTVNKVVLPKFPMRQEVTPKNIKAHVLTVSVQAYLEPFDEDFAKLKINYLSLLKAFKKKEFIENCDTEDLAAIAQARKAKNTTEISRALKMLIPITQKISHMHSNDVLSESFFEEISRPFLSEQKGANNFLNVADLKSLIEDVKRKDLVFHEDIINITTSVLLLIESLNKPELHEFLPLFTKALQANLQIISESVSGSYQQRELQNFFTIVESLTSLLQDNQDPDGLNFALDLYKLELFLMTVGTIYGHLLPIAF